MRAPATSCRRAARANEPSAKSAVASSPYPHRPPRLPRRMTTIGISRRTQPIRAFPQPEVGPSPIADDGARTAPVQLGHDAVGVGQPRRQKPGRVGGHGPGPTPPPGRHGDSGGDVAWTFLLFTELNNLIMLVIIWFLHAARALGHFRPLHRRHLLHHRSRLAVFLLPEGRS